MKELISITDQAVLDKIYLIRDKKVMMDRDLAVLYNVETRVLNQAVKRNLNRFPPDFMFQLTPQELENWISQNVISNSQKLKMGLRKLPYVFTEQGVAMLSSVLKSETAVETNIQIIRVFSRMREMFLAHKDILIKLDQLERKLINQDEKAVQHEQEIQRIFLALKQLIDSPMSGRKKIGFNVAQ